jgi:hypothetical protein
MVSAKQPPLHREELLLQPHLLLQAQLLQAQLLVLMVLRTVLAATVLKVEITPERSNPRLAGSDCLLKGCI